MPSCLVNRCPSKSGKPGQSPDIHLHRFPKDPTRIRTWLMQTGQRFENLEKVIEMIVEGQKQTKYWLCSLHFAADCYISTPNGPGLSKDAIPSIFTGFAEGERVIEESLRKPRPRGKKRPMSTLSQQVCNEPSSSILADTFHQDTDASLGVEFTKEGYCTIGTQTDYTITNSIIEYKAYEEQTIDNAFQSLDCPVESTPVATTGKILLKDNIEDASPLRKKAHVKTVLFKEITTEMSDDLCGLSPIQYHAEKENEGMEFDQENDSLEQPPKNDESYNPHESSFEATDMSSSFSFFKGRHIEEQTITDERIASDRKFLIFESCLDNFLYKINCLSEQSCKGKVRCIKKKLDGSCCKITATCDNGHKFLVFETQPKINKISTGNIMIAASILFSGLNYQKIKEFFGILGVVCISEKSYYRYQSKYLFPAIDLAWLAEKEQLKNALQHKKLCIAGDGQCDSPGHSAKYCVYTVLDTVTDKILDFEVIQRSQCTSSTAMEKFGFGIVMDRLIQNGYNIQIFASDRHVGIRKAMRIDYEGIEHQFDIWHYAKSIRKKLSSASHQKLCEELVPWMDKIILHFWWSVQTCKRDPKLLEEKWLSLLEHIVDCHEWEGNLYSKCSHGTLDNEDRDILWLKKESLPFQNLEKIVCSKQLIKDLPHLKHNCHTGGLENFHSLVLKYRTKRIHYGIDAMEARTKLAALTHNHNVGRQQAVVTVENSSTERIGTKRTVLVLPKGKSRWILRNIYEKTNVKYLEGILLDVIKIVRGEKQSNWVSRVPSLPPNIANVERPNKEDMKNQRISRFGANVTPAI